MTQVVIDLLNKAFAVEPKTINALVQHAVPCSDELANQELLLVMPEEQRIGWQISVLGLINSILIALKLKPVAVKVADTGEDAAYEKILGFCEYTLPDTVAPPTVATQQPAIWSTPIHQPPAYHWSPCPDITAYELAMCMPMIVAGTARLFDQVERLYKLLPTNVQRHWDLFHMGQKPSVGEWRSFGEHMYCFGMPEVAGDYLWFHPNEGPEKEQLLQNYRGDVNAWGRNTWYRCVRQAEKATEPVVEAIPPITKPVARQFNIGCFEASDIYGNHVWGAASHDDEVITLDSLRDIGGMSVGFNGAYADLKDWATSNGIRLKQSTLCITHDFETTAGVAVVT